MISVEEEMQVAGHLSPPAQEKDEPQGNELLKGTQINDTVTKILAAQDETLRRLSEPHTCRFTFKRRQLRSGERIRRKRSLPFRTPGPSTSSQPATA